MDKRIILLIILTLNDFLLHLVSAFNLTVYDPVWPLFHWISQQTFYDFFWSLYWGFGFLLVLSLLVRRPR